MEKVTKSKKEARDEKMDQKMEEQVQASLEGAPTIEKKFELLLRKHVETERKLRQELKNKEKLIETLIREKDNLQREHNKSVLMRDKFQEVCREQQKLIKSVKNESMQKIREEEERRKESQCKFQTSLNEITQSLNKNNEENTKLRDHNIEMTKKLKYLAEQYQTREQQLEKLNEQVQLETQINQAKLAKFQVEAAMEKEILIKEKQIALEKLLHSQKMVNELNEREIALKEQLDLYTAKYDDFHNSLQKSNDIFATYKVELEKMSKNTKKLEKESLEWKMRWEKSNANVIELVMEKKERDEHAVRCNKQVEQLQKLLRALQHERTHLYNVIRSNNIECPAMPQLPPEPEPLITTPITSVTDKDKMERMSQNCAEIKQTLEHIQNQVKFLNLKMPEVEPETKEQQLQLQEDAFKKRQKKKQKSKNGKSPSCNAPSPCNASKIKSSSSNIGEPVSASAIEDLNGDANECPTEVNEITNIGDQVSDCEIKLDTDSSPTVKNELNEPQQSSTQLSSITATPIETVVNADAVIVSEENSIETK